MKVNVFQRVSTKSQKKDFTIQDRLINNFSTKLGIFIDKTRKYIGSAYNKDPYDFKNKKIKNRMLVFASFDRFSRSQYDTTYKLMKKIIKRNNKITFIRENLFINNLKSLNENKDLIKKYSIESNGESRLKSERMKNYWKNKANVQKKIRDETDKTDNKLYNEKFILACRNNKKINPSQIKWLLLNCGNTINKDKLLNNEIIIRNYTKTNIMTYKNILKLLNNYSIIHKDESYLKYLRDTYNTWKNSSINNEIIENCKNTKMYKAKISILKESHQQMQKSLQLMNNMQIGDMEMSDDFIKSVKSVFNTDEQDDTEDGITTYLDEIELID